MVAMSGSHRIGVLLIVAAVVVVGCGQQLQSPTGDTGQAPAAAPGASPSATGSAAVEPDTAAVEPDAAKPQQPPAEVTGRIMCGPPQRSTSNETLDVGDEGLVLTRDRGGAWRQTAKMSDQRLEGTIYHTYETDAYAKPGAKTGPGVWAATRRIENEAGAWETISYGGSYSEDTPIGDSSTVVYVGEGAFEGLIAILEETPLEDPCGADVRGIIFDRAPVPEPYDPD
jgi:hypothetical protein